MCKECLYQRYSPKKCRWHVSDNFQFPLKGTTINKTSRHSLLGALDTASISLMDWLSYSDSAVLRSLYRRLCAPDCASRAAVFLPYRYTAVSGLLEYINKQHNWIITTLGLFHSGDVAHTPCNVIIIAHYLIRNVNYLYVCDVTAVICVHVVYVSVQACVEGVGHMCSFTPAVLTYSIMGWRMNSTSHLRSFHVSFHAF